MSNGTTQPRDTNMDDDPVARQTERILKEQFAAEGIDDTGLAESNDLHPAPFREGIENTDTGNSERFVHLHGDRLRYVRKWDTWVVWNGLKWELDPKAVLVTELAKDVSRQLFRELAEMSYTDENQKKRGSMTSWANRSANGNPLSQIVKLARGIDGIITSHRDFDTDHWAFGVGNGWIDLRDGSFHEPDPSKLMMQHSDVDWNLDAGAPTWDRALREWLPDPELRHYFQRIVGEAAVGQVRENILVLIYGGGANGKGTAIGALSKVFGPYFVIPHKSLLMATKHGEHQTEVAELFRKRLAVAAETKKGSKLNESRIKELTGGDQLQARRMREDPWKFYPTHSLWLQTNHLPDVDDMGTGMWRRVRVLEWPAEFTGNKMDTELKEKLDSELEGILRWVIDGAVLWANEGLNEPVAVEEATKQYQTSQDLIGQFFEDIGAQTGPGHFTAGGAITEKWRTWTGAEYGNARSGQELKQRLEEHGYIHTKGRNSQWTGFSIPEQPNEATHQDW